MIRTLRNSGLGQLFLGSIVVAIILAFVFTGAPSGNAPSTGDCAVEIGKSCISPKEFQASYRLLTSIGLNDNAAKNLRLREQVAVGLAEREVLLEEARLLGIATSEKDIDDELFDGRTRVSLPADGAERLAMSLAMCVNGPAGCAPGTIGIRAISVKQGGSFNFKLYKRTIRVVSGRSPGQFKEMQEKEYTAERMRQLIRTQVRVSENEAFLAYSRARSQATARTVDLKTSWFERFAQAPSDEEVSSWIGNNKSALDAAVKAAEATWKVGCSVVSEIRLDNADPTSDKTEALRTKAEELRQLARSKDHFSMLARKESDAASATLGGRIGCLAEDYGSGSAVLIEAAAELKKAGDLSPVIETIRGFHILRLVDHVSEENKEELLRTFLAFKLSSEARAQEATKKFAEALIESAKSGSSLAETTDAMIQELLKEGPFALEEDAEKKDLPENAAYSSDDIPKSDISRPVTIEQSPIENAGEDESPAEILFKLEKDDDVAAKPIVTRDGFAVLQLKSKDLITREKFKEERVGIMMRLQKRKAEQALAAHVMALVKKAGGVKMNPKFIPPEVEEDESDGEKQEKGS